MGTTNQMIEWTLSTGMLLHIIIENKEHTLAIDKIFLKDNVAYLCKEDINDLSVKIDITNMKIYVGKLNTKNLKPVKKIDSVYNGLRETFANTLKEVIAEKTGASYFPSGRIYKDVNTILNGHVSWYDMDMCLSEHSWLIHHDDKEITLAEAVDIIPRDATY